MKSASLCLPVEVGLFVVGLAAWTVAQSRPVEIPLASAPATGIEPVDLGLPEECPSVRATSISDAATPDAVHVSAFGYRCSPGGYNLPLLWTSGTGMVALSVKSPATGGIARSVSNAGIAVGNTSNGAFEAFERPPGGPMEALPVLASTLFSLAESIDSTGRFILGEVSDGVVEDLVRWEWGGASWQIEILSPSGESVEDPVAIALDGTAVSRPPPGSGALDSFVRIYFPEGGFEELPETGVRANDLSDDGRAIVGFRWRACPSTPDCLMEVPTLWQRHGSAWEAEELAALDDVDSEAMGVARVGGRLVIVGYGFTKSDAVMRAVAWLPDSSGAYGEPIRLAALGSGPKTPAEARAVNRHGQVVGTSFNSAGFHAVLWTLPELPHLFVDDFESGNLNGWAKAVGGEPGS